MGMVLILEKTKSLMAKLHMVLIMFCCLMVEYKTSSIQLTIMLDTSLMYLILEPLSHIIHQSMLNLLHTTQLQYMLRQFITDRMDNSNKRHTAIDNLYIDMRTNIYYKLL